MARMLFYVLILLFASSYVIAKPVNLHLPDRSASGSQSSISNTPLPVEVHVTEHDGYFFNHQDFYHNCDKLLAQAHVIIAVIDQENKLKHWQGSVNYVLDYNVPAIDDDMLDYWHSFDEILYVYHKFKKTCHHLGTDKECAAEKIISLGDSYYSFHFRGVSNGLCVLRIIEMPSYGVQQKAIDKEKRDLEDRSLQTTISISQTHFTPIMLMETSVDEIRREFNIHRTAMHIHEESIMTFIERSLKILTESCDLQEAFKAKTALQEVMKRVERFARDFDTHTTEVITQTSDLKQKTMNMLEYSEMSSGKFTLHSSDRVNLIDLCHEAHSLFSAKAAVKRVGFITRISAGRYNPYIMVDHQRFRQALFAVLQNSVQYSHQNGGSIVFTLVMEQDTIRFIIRDYGCGINEENLERICDAFYSYDMMGNHQQTLGLGLFLAKRIIEAMKGVLHIQSDEGVSTTVEISLPMSFIARHEMHIESVPSADDTAPDTQTIAPRKQSMFTFNAQSEPESFYNTVILSEDSPLPGKLLKKFIEKIGYGCELYETGEEALAAFYEAPQKYFAALLDFFTPPSPMRGSEVASAMLQKSSHLFIAIISANNDVVVRDAVNAVGVYFLHKPFQHHKEELSKQLNDAYHQHRRASH